MGRTRELVGFLVASMVLKKGSIGLMTASYK